MAGDFTDNDRKMLQDTHDSIIKFATWVDGHEKAHKVFEEQYKEDRKESIEQCIATREVLNERLNNHRHRIDSNTGWRYYTLGIVIAISSIIGLLVKLGVMGHSNTVSGNP